MDGKLQVRRHCSRHADWNGAPSNGGAVGRDCFQQRWESERTDLHPCPVHNQTEESETANALFFLSRGRRPSNGLHAAGGAADPDQQGGCARQGWRVQRLANGTGRDRNRNVNPSRPESVQGECPSDRYLPKNLILGGENDGFVL